MMEKETFDCRVAFAETLIELAQNDERIVAVCNDSVSSSNLGEFRKRFPDRLINVGIAEQDMVGVAAGLANGGFIPFVCAAGPFLSGRATEQVKADIAYSNYGVVLCAMSPGMAYGELGPTHHSIEDLSWMRAIMNLDIIVPADPAQTIAAVKWAASANRPIYMRVGRFKVPSVSDASQANVFTPGKIHELKNGHDITFIVTGTMVSRALDAANILQQENISARVLNVSTIQPLDKEAVLKAANETKAIVVAEEGVLSGGLGAAIAMEVAQHKPVPMRFLGVNTFAPTGSASYLLDHFNLTSDGLIAAAKELLV